MSVTAAVSDAIYGAGESVTMRQVARTFDPATGKNSSVVNTDTEVVAVATRVDASTVDGSLVLVDDMIFTIGADSLLNSPIKGDEIIRGAETFVVVDVQTVRRDGADVAYATRVRGT